MIAALFVAKGGCYFGPAPLPRPPALDRAERPSMTTIEPSLPSLHARLAPTVRERVAQRIAERSNGSMSNKKDKNDYGPHITGPTYRELEVQRDELLAILRKIADGWALVDPMDGHTRGLAVEEEIAALLAKVKQ